MSEFIKDYLIVGVVREVKGSSVLIRMLDNMSQIVHFFKGKKYTGAMIGSFIGIIRGQYIIVGKIEREYAYDQQKEINVQEFSKDRFIREIEITVVGSFRNDEYIQGIVAFPQVFNNVTLLTIEQQKKVLQLDNNRNPDLPNLPFGTLWPDGDRMGLPWYELFNTHIAIFGNTGSGKSNTLTKLYSELFKLFYQTKLNIKDSKFIFIDFNGEYTEKNVLAKNKVVKNLSQQNNGKDKIIIPSKYFWNIELLSIFFGATEQTQQPFLSRVISFYFKEDRKIKSNLSYFLSLAFKDVYSSPNLNGLDLLKIVIKNLNLSNNDVSEWIDKTLYNSTYNSFYSRETIEGWNKSHGNYYFNNDELLLEEEVKRIRDANIQSNYDDSNPITELLIAVYFKMIFELRQKTIQYDHIAPLLNRIDARVSDFSKIIEVDNTKDIIFTDNITVISLNELKHDYKLLIPMILAKISYEQNKELNKDKKNIYNLVIDEAHNILSEISIRESEKWKDYRLEIFEEIIKEGRKFGYYLTLCSQRPADISQTIVSQIHNYFIHRLVNENDLRLLDKALSTLDNLTKSNIPILAPGQVVCTGVSFKYPLVVQVDKLPYEESPKSESSNLENIWYSK